MSNNSERLKQILVAVSTIGVIVFNWLSAKGFLGVSMQSIADKYGSEITPAGYAFSIWGLIYLGLIFFSIYQMLPRNLEKFAPVRSVYILNCAANCAWLFFWHQERIALCAGIILILLGTLAFINSKLKFTESNAEFWFVKFPFGLYFGWVTAATILNFTLALVYLNFQMPDSTAVLTGAALLFAAVALGVLIRFKLNNPFYPLAIAWALTAIAVEQSGKTLIVSTAAVGVIALLITALTFLILTPKKINE